MSGNKAGRSRRGRGAFASNVNRVMKSRLHTLVCGRKLNVPADPPPFEYNPWNQFTLTIADTGDSTVKVSTVNKAMKSVLGSIEDFSMRFQMVRVWSLTRGEPLHLSPFAIIGQADSNDLVDFPSLVNYAKLGYEWPSSFQQSVFHVGDVDDILFTVDVKGYTKWLGYLHLLWKTNTKPLAISSHPAHYYIGSEGTPSDGLDLAVSNRPSYFQDLV